MRRLDPDQRAAIARALAQQAAPTGTRAFLAGPEDLEALHALGEALFGDEALSRADWRRRLLRSHGFAMGLRDGEGVVCYTLVELNLRQRRVYVVETGTAPRARARGLARWVRAHLHGVVAALGYRSLDTHVRLRNVAAQRLNLSLGMGLRERISAYYDDGEDALRYGARLGEGVEIAAISLS